MGLNSHLGLLIVNIIKIWVIIYINLIVSLIISKSQFFSFTTTFPLYLIDFYRKFRGEGPVFENPYFRKTEFSISSPVKTGMSYLKSSILTSLFLFF